jgi:hypothetical protein
LDIDERCEVRRNVLLGKPELIEREDGEKSADCDSHGQRPRVTSLDDEEEKHGQEDYGGEDSETDVSAVAVRGAECKG